MTEGVTGWIVTVKENDQGELFIELPPGVISHLDLQDDDTVMWISREDGSFELFKVPYEEEDVGC